MYKTEIELNSQADIIVARGVSRELANKLGFGPADQTRLCTAISELTRNVIQYAGKGVCIISDGSNKENIKIRVVVEDHGPGIADIDKAMEFGFSTGTGLGAGLPGARVLVHNFKIESRPGHTKVTVEMVGRRT